MNKKYFKHIFVFLLCIQAVLRANAQLLPSVDFVVAPYVQSVSDTSFHLLWETAEPGRDIVLLAVAEFNVLKPSFTEVARDNNYNLYHNIKVTGLKPGGKYFYKTITINRTGDTISSKVVPFNIPDFSKSPVTFAVIGDTQNRPLIWGKFAGLIYRERPLFLIHVGDMVQYGPNKVDWVDEFFKPAADLFSVCPIYPAIGNHEMNHDFFYRYFELPESESFYTIRKGNALFVFANTNRDILPGSEQYRKLENILASAKETWKIVVHHQPVYTSDEYGYGNTWYQLGVHGDPNEMHLKRLYETYAVDVVLNGHIHCYERTWPIYKDRVDRIRGVTYITLGGGGGDLDKAAANKTWYAAKTRSAHHFLSVNIVDNLLYAQAIDSSGAVFDNWSIDKQMRLKTLNAPLITSEKQYFIDSTQAVITNLNHHGVLRIKDHDAYLSYEGEKAGLVVKDTRVVSACIVDENQESETAEKKFEKLPVLPAVKKADKKVKVSYYEGFFTQLPEFGQIKTVKSFEFDSVTLVPVQPRVQDHFAVKFTGSFVIPETDVYRFMLESYDGSRFIVDGQVIIDNDGMHYEIRKEAFTALEKGIHTFEIQYFDFTRRETLRLQVGKQTESMYGFNRLVRY